MRRKAKARPRAQSPEVRRIYITPSPADSRQRSLPPNLGLDAAALAPADRQRQMIADGRTIYTGFGVVTGAVHMKANMTIGHAWVPQYAGRDQAFKRAAEELINDWSFSPDVRGLPYDLQKDLWLTCKSIDVDGDIGIVLARDSDGYPRIQLVEAHRIAQVGDIARGGVYTPPVVSSGRYAGRWIYGGVIMDQNMRPVAYRVVNPGVSTLSHAVGPNDYRDIPASSMLLAYDPTWYSSARGIPSLCYGILEWYDALETRDAEKIAAKVNSSLALIHKNETGSAPALRNDILGESSLATPHVEMLQGGMIQYIRHQDDISAHRSDRPSGGWQWLMDHMIKCAFMGLGLPSEAVYALKDLQSAGTRAVLSQVQRTIEQRQDTLFPFAKRIVQHAVGSFIARGDLPFTRDWWQWSFTYPARATIDAGREARARQDDYTLGLASMSDITAEQGGSAEELLRRRVADYQLAKQLSESSGVPIEYLISQAAITPPGTPAMPAEV